VHGCPDVVQVLNFPLKQIRFIADELDDLNETFAVKLRQQTTERQLPCVGFNQQGFLGLPWEKV